MSDLTTELRRAVLTRLKATPDVVALVPAASIYSGRAPREPAWPFILWGAPTSVPLEGNCYRDGETIRIAIHAFAGPRYEGGAMVETGEDAVGRIASAVRNSLHNWRAPLPSGVFRLRLISSNRALDGDEADEWHLTQDFRARVFA